MFQDADEVAGAVRSAWIAAALVGVVVVVVGFVIAGLTGAALGLGGSLLGIGNLRLAAYSLRRAPIAFLGSSLPRLAVITALLVALVFWMGPVGVWGLLGLLATHLAQVGAVVRSGLKATAR
ncbi:MAG: hypothetical protein ACREN4_08065 [Candidatus Dormibacteria bacterium]